MATKKVTYAEPASYFNADMKKAIRDYEKEQKAKAKSNNATSKKNK